VPAKPILARAGNVCNGELQENVPSDELSREREREKRTAGTCGNWKQLGAGETNTS